jgi:hypothetical protein
MPFYKLCVPYFQESCLINPGEFVANMALLILIIYIFFKFKIFKYRCHENGALSSFNLGSPLLCPKLYLPKKKFFGSIL